MIVRLKRFYDSRQSEDNETSNMHETLRRIISHISGLRENFRASRIKVRPLFLSLFNFENEIFLFLLFFLARERQRGRYPFTARLVFRCTSLIFYSCYEVFYNVNKRFSNRAFSRDPSIVIYDPQRYDQKGGLSLSPSSAEPMRFI